MNISELFLLIVIVYLITTFLLLKVIKTVTPDLVKDNFVVLFACTPILNTMLLMILVIVYLAGWLNGYIKHIKHNK